MNILDPETRSGPGSGIGAGRAISGWFFGLLLAGCASLPEHATREHLAEDMQKALGQSIAWREVNSREVEAQLAAILENPLTPTAAVRIALLHSRSLQRLFAAYGLAQADYLAAVSLPNPVLDLEARSRGGSAATTVEWSIVQNFLAVIRLKTNRQIAETQLRAATVQLTAEVLDLQERVLTAYYSHVGAKQTLELRRSVADAAGASYEFARKLHDAGNIRGLDLSNEQAMYEFTQVAFADAEAELLISRERLSRELELWRPEHAWTAASRLPKMPGMAMALDDFEAQVIARSLRLQADQLLLDGQYQRLGLERSTRLIDDLDLGLAGEREEGDWDRGISLGLSLPISQQGQARVLRAQSQLKSMELSLYLDAVRLRSMAREAAIGLRQYRRLVVHDLEVRLPLTTRILRQTQLEVNAMQTGLFELMLAKQGQLEAGGAFVGHLRDYWLARVLGSSICWQAVRLKWEPVICRTLRRWRRSQKTENIEMNRRGFLSASAATVAGASVATNAVAKDQANEDQAYWDKTHSGRPAPEAQRPLALGEYRSVITPNGVTLPFKIIDGVKVYHLVAEELWHQYAPGLKAQCWGYNGRVHGPTIEGVQGERIRVYVTNRLPAPTSVHWHGVYLPNGMDGVGGLNQRAIKPGETFKYEWTWRQHGTFMYHSHHDEMTQMGLGLMGMIVIHPRNPEPDYQVDKDFVIMLSEWKITPGTYRPDPNSMADFNILTMNAQCYPGTAPLVVQTGDRVRLRFGNLSAMDHHPIHLHGYYFRISATDGGRIPRDAQWPETTVLVPVGSTRDVEFLADEPGDWAMHCHMTHHMMNQMGHDIPNMIGLEPGNFDQRVRSLLPGYMTMGQDGMGEHGIHVERGHMKVPENSLPMVGAWGPFDYITMGGMFTIVKVRDQVAGQDDPGWCQHPHGTRADLAAADDLLRDGIKT